MSATIGVLYITLTIAGRFHTLDCRRGAEVGRRFPCSTSCSVLNPQRGHSHPASKESNKLTLYTLAIEHSAMLALLTESYIQQEVKHP